MKSVEINNFPLHKIRTLINSILVFVKSVTKKTKTGTQQQQLQLFLYLGIVYDETIQIRSRLSRYDDDDDNVEMRRSSDV